MPKFLDYRTYGFTEADLHKAVPRTRARAPARTSRAPNATIWIEADQGAGWGEREEWEGSMKGRRGGRGGRQGKRGRWR